MKILNASIILLVVALAFGGCERNDCAEANGERVIKKDTLSSFNAIRLDIPVDLYVQLDTALEQPRIEYITQGNIQKLIKASVISNVLTFTFDECVNNSDNTRINIFTNSLRAIESNSTGDIFSLQKISVDSLELSLNNQGEIDLTIQTEYLQALHRGRGNLLLNGYSNKSLLRNVSSGEIFADELALDTVSVEIGGSGSSYLRVFDLINANLTNRGNLFYKGFPTINAQVTGQGQVIDNND